MILTPMIGRLKVALTLLPAATPQAIKELDSCRTCFQQAIRNRCIKKFWPWSIANQLMEILAWGTEIKAFGKRASGSKFRFSIPQKGYFSELDPNSFYISIYSGSLELGILCYWTDRERLQTTNSRPLGISIFNRITHNHFYTAKVTPPRWVWLWIKAFAYGGGAAEIRQSRRDFGADTWP